MPMLTRCHFHCQNKQSPQGDILNSPVESKNGIRKNKLVRTMGAKFQVTTEEVRLTSQEVVHRMF